MLSALLCAAIGLSACSGGAAPIQIPVASGTQSSESVSPATEAPTSLTLAYDRKDGLNPYTARSQMNRALITLLYDSVFRLDEVYEPVPGLALEGKTEGAICTVTIDTNRHFSDGTPVKASDVVYSFQQAAAAGSPYAGRFSGVSCSPDAGQANRVIFTLPAPDIFFLNLLTFPVIKEGSGHSAIPVGSGRYTAAADGEDILLIRNSAHPTPFGEIEKIRLITLPDAEALASSARVGLVSCTFSEQSTGASYQTGLSSVPVDLNCLVFLGINRSHPLLAQGDFRKALYLAVDRDKLCERSFASRAVPAYTPFNPAVDWLPDAEFFDSQNISRAEALLDALGLDKRNTEGYRINNTEKVALPLLVNSENAARLDAAARLRDQLARVGVELTVEALPYEQYSARIAAGGYVLYLGEIKLPYDMDIGPLLRSDGSMGLTADAALQAGYQAFRAGAVEADAFLADFLAENPFVPLVYRKGVLAFSHGRPSYIVATASDLFYGIQKP
jgi:peptide/nickel transport system substrate-binding protein